MLIQGTIQFPPGFFYQCLEDYWEEFKESYAYFYEKDYGRWRPVVEKTVERFLECGIFHQGFARVRCGSCGACSKKYGSRRSLTSWRIPAKPDKLSVQIKSANREFSRLLDAYQSGAIELPELQKRQRLVNSKLEMLEREQQLLEQRHTEQKEEIDLRTSLEKFAALVSGNLKHISFENKQKLLRIVLG